MIHNDIQNQLQLLVKGSAPPLIEVADHPIETPQWTLGQRLPAHVIASLPNGRFQVQVEDQILDMNLPRNTQPGETLELTYNGNSPRLTFILNPEKTLTLNTPATGDFVKLSNSPEDLNVHTAAGKGGVDAGKLNAATNTPAANATTTSGDTARPLVVQPNVYIADAPVELSTTAKLLGDIQQKAQGTNKQSPSAIISQPVLSSPPTQAKPLADALSKTLSQSGLFYESHQLQWISGERPLSMLRQEPQALMSPNNTAKISMSSGQDGQPAVTNNAAAPTINAHTLPLVQQQLEMLDSRQVVWQGQVWPGQEMRWEVEEETHGRHSADEPVSTWNTSLRLVLPRLGDVAAKIMLTAEGVRVDLSVAQDKSATLLKNERMGLVESFNAAGLSLMAVTVNRDEQAA